QAATNAEPARRTRRCRRGIESRRIKAFNENRDPILVRCRNLRRQRMSVFQILWARRQLRRRKLVVVILSNPCNPWMRVICFQSFQSREHKEKFFQMPQVHFTNLMRPLASLMYS